MMEATNEKRERMLIKVRALMDKAEATEFPEEAKAFMETAQSLLTEYALDIDELMVIGEVNKLGDKIVTIAVRVSDPYSKTRAKLLHAVAQSNNCRVVMGSRSQSEWLHTEVKETLYVDNPKTNKRSKAGVLVYITGFSRNVDASVLLFTSLLIQSTSEFARLDIPSYESKGTYYNHYLIGYTSAIGARLRAAQRNASKDAQAKAEEQGVDLLPVLVAREEQVNKEYEQTWQGKLGRGRQTHYNLGAGYGAGRQAAARADVGNARVGARRALGR